MKTCKMCRYWSERLVNRTRQRRIVGDRIGEEFDHDVPAETLGFNLNWTENVGEHIISLGNGICSNPKLDSEDEDGIMFNTEHGHTTFGPDFGCIHHEPK